MEDIDKRLRDSTDACIKSFEAWVKASKSPETREGLMEAMHEVRKVVARLEIEIAVSERDRLGSRPIPIPPHRSQRKRGGEAGEEAMDNGNEDFDADEAFQQAGNSDQQPRRQHQGGGGRHRRPMHRSGGGGGNQGNGNNNGNSDNA